MILKGLCDTGVMVDENSAWHNMNTFIGINYGGNGNRYFKM